MVEFEAIEYKIQSTIRLDYFLLFSNLVSFKKARETILPLIWSNVVPVLFIFYENKPTRALKGGCHYGRCCKHR